MRPLKHLLFTAAVAASMGLGPATAQQIGPPIPPDQVLRQQNQPMATPPSVPVPANPPAGSGSTGSRVGPAPRVDGSRDRASRCQHEATVERVPRRQRSAYIHNCIQGD